jgi:hypothetical protein
MEIEELEAKYSDLAVLDVIREMDKIREIREQYEEKLGEINKEYDFLRLNLVPRMMDDQGIDNIRVDGVGRISLTGDMYVSIKAENRQAAYQYFIDIGKSSLIQETINPSTLKAAVKAMIKAGEEVPEDLIKVTPFTRASITKK